MNWDSGARNSAPNALPLAKGFANECPIYSARQKRGCDLDRHWPVVMDLEEREMQMKFKVGDRVAVYENCKRFTGMVLNDGHQSIQVELDDDRVLPFHPKQCRRLIKKPRRRIAVSYDTGACEFSVRLLSGDNIPNDKEVEFIEVRKAKKG